MTGPRIRKAQPEDADSVRRICGDAFRLTAFHTDPLIPTACRDRIVWTLYAEPAFRRPRPPCLVADISGTAAGFLLYGGYADLSHAVGRPVSNILLLAVLPDHQNRGLGRRLLEAGLDLFRRRRSRLVTVGTDAGNAPALRLYTSSGFRPVLHWRTWRLRLPASKTSPPLEPPTFPPPPGPGLLTLSSFLEDPDIPPEIRETTLSSLSRRAPSPQALACLSDEGWAVFEPQPDLSHLCGIPFLRLAALHADAPLSADSLLENGLRQLASRHRTTDILVESFLRSGHPLEESFRRAGFRPVHEAVTLHLHDP